MNVKLSALARPDLGAIRMSGLRQQRLSLPSMRPSHIIFPLVIPGLVLFAWQLTTSLDLLPVQILPAPKLVVSTFVDLIRGGDIAANLQISLWRIACGFLIG